ncbi:MAG: phosphatidylserine decarboxylase family protein [Bacteroidales bacterium]
MKIHKEGYRFILAAVLILAALNATVLIFFNQSWFLPLSLLFLSVLITAFILFFFRSPDRSITRPDDSLLMAPADGKIVVIEETIEKEYIRKPAIQISIFMSPLNIHCNRYPVSGTVKEVTYHQGKYLVAWHPKSSELNERCTIVLETESGTEIVIRQIAGFVARRIVTYARQGQIVKQGDEMGFIKFGSRVDMFVPLSFNTEIAIDQKVKASLTVIGQL